MCFLKTWSCHQIICCHVCVAYHEVCVTVIRTFLLWSLRLHYRCYRPYWEWASAWADVAPLFSETQTIPSTKQKAVTSHDTVVSYCLKQLSEAVAIRSTTYEQKKISSHDSVHICCLHSSQRSTTKYIRTKSVRCQLTIEPNQITGNAMGHAMVILVHIRTTPSDPYVSVS